jgi:hypothetical protein
VSYALWPGDGVFCTRVAGPVFAEPLYQLVDSEGRMHELRPHRVGEVPARPPR